MPPDAPGPKVTPPTDHARASGLWEVDPESMRGRLWLLILDKVVIGLMIGCAVFAYDYFKTREARRYEALRERTMLEGQQEVRSVQLQFERARFLNDNLPRLYDDDVPVANRALTLKALTVTSSIEPNLAANILSELALKGLDNSVFSLVATDVLVSGIDGVTDALFSDRMKNRHIRSQGGRYVGFNPGETTLLDTWGEALRAVIVLQANGSEKLNDAQWVGAHFETLFELVDSYGYVAGEGGPQDALAVNVCSALLCWYGALLHPDVAQFSRSDDARLSAAIEAAATHFPSLPGDDTEGPGQLIEAVLYHMYGESSNLDEPQDGTDIPTMPDHLWPRTPSFAIAAAWRYPYYREADEVTFLTTIVRVVAESVNQTEVRAGKAQNRFSHRRLYNLRWLSEILWRVPRAVPPDDPAWETILAWFESHDESLSDPTTYDTRRMFESAGDCFTSLMLAMCLNGVCGQGDVVDLGRIGRIQNLRLYRYWSEADAEARHPYSGMALMAQDNCRAIALLSTKTPASGTAPSRR